SISLTCRATSIDQASNGFPPSDRMFFPGTDLLPPRAGITAISRFPSSIRFLLALGAAPDSASGERTYGAEPLGCLRVHSYTTFRWRHRGDPPISVQLCHSFETLDCIPLLYRASGGHAYHILIERPPGKNVAGNL